MSRWRVAFPGILAVAVMIAACGGEPEIPALPTPVCAPGQIDGDLSLYVWPDSIPLDVLDGFRRRYGVDMAVTNYDSNETLLAQLQVRADAYDVAVPSDWMVDILVRDQLLLEIDRNALTNLDGIDPLFLDPPFDPEGRHSVPILWGTVGLGINLNVVEVDDQPTWGLVFDEEATARWAGRISLLDDPRQTLGAALKYLGYSVNTTVPDQVAAAADLVAATAPAIGIFDSIEYGEQLVEGEIDVAQGRSDVFFEAFDAANAWNDYAYVVPAEGTIAWVDNLVVPVTSASPCTAHTFIDYLLEAENSAAITNHTQFASPNLAAVEFVDIEILQDPAIYPPAEARAAMEFLAHTGDFEIWYLEEFARARE
jgi:spermidine/putrescine-binding protein